MWPIKLFVATIDDGDEVTIEAANENDARRQLTEHGCFVFEVWEDDENQTVKYLDS